MTLAAALNVLLARYTGQDRLWCWYSYCQSHPPELERLIGCFINTLALRTDLSGNPDFREVLKRVQQVALEGYAHQEVAL